MYFYMFIHLYLPWLQISSASLSILFTFRGLMPADFIRFLSSHNCLQKIVLCFSSRLFSSLVSEERQVTGCRFSRDTKSLIPLFLGKSQLRSSSPTQVPYFSASDVKRVLVTTQPL